MNLAELHRPRQWCDVLGQDKILAKLDLIRQRNGLGGRAFWLSGGSGSGKTSIGRLIANEVAGEWCIHEIDATDLSAACWKLTTYDNSKLSSLVYR